MINAAEAKTFEAVLEARGDSMAVCQEVPWLTRFAEIPADASAPLAMSGPHPRAVGSYGEEFRDWMLREYKVKLRWWQDLAATRQLEHDADGVLVFRELVAFRRTLNALRFSIVMCLRFTHGIREDNFVKLVGHGSEEWNGELD